MKLENAEMGYLWQKENNKNLPIFSHQQLSTSPFYRVLVIAEIGFLHSLCLPSGRHHSLGVSTAPLVNPRHPHITGCILHKTGRLASVLTTYSLVRLFLHLLLSRLQLPIKASCLSASRYLDLGGLDEVGNGGWWKDAMAWGGFHSSSSGYLFDGLWFY